MSEFTKNGKELVSKIIAGENLKESIKKSVTIMGGFVKFVSKGDTIVIKPNFNTNDPFPASSDPEFVKCVIELLYEAGAKKVILAESSRFFSNSTKMMAEMKKIAEKAKAEVIVLTEKNEWVKINVNGKVQKKFNIAKIYAEKDKKTKFVWLPCMKTHYLADFTLSLKLLIGTLKPSEKLRMHIRMKLQERIADLNLAVSPDLIIMDARKCFITGGPIEGLVKAPDLIMASGDRIAIDVEAIKVIREFDGNALSWASPWDFRQIKAAVADSIGNVKSEKDYSVLFGDTLKK